MSGVIFVGDDDSRARTSVVIWLLRYLQQRRANPAYFRFASSGIRSIEQSEAAEVYRCCSLDQSLGEMLKYCYQSTAPIHIAARQEHRFIDANVLAQQYAWNLSTHPYVLVDGVGNVTCPLVLERARVLTQEDLIRSLHLNVVLVIQPSGEPQALSNALMTIQYCRSRGLPFQGVILTNFDENQYYHKDFMTNLEYLGKTHVLAMTTEAGFQLRADITQIFVDQNTQSLD